MARLGETIDSGDSYRGDRSDVKHWLRCKEISSSVRKNGCTRLGFDDRDWEVTVNKGTSAGTCTTCEETTPIYNERQRLEMEKRT